MKLTDENKITIINAVITLAEICNAHPCRYCPFWNENDMCDLYALEGVNIADLKKRLDNYNDNYINPMK